MISREEAIADIWTNDRMPTLQKVETDRIVKTIYDSIGTCNECEHGHTTKAGVGFRICDDGKGLQKENWYCADFERKNK